MRAIQKSRAVDDVVGMLKEIDSIRQNEKESSPSINGISANQDETIDNAFEWNRFGGCESNARATFDCFVAIGMLRWTKAAWLESTVKAKRDEADGVTTCRHF
jgi:hypothetical protein